MFVTKLTLKPEHSEVIATDHIGIDAGLILDGSDVFSRDARRRNASCGRKCIADHRPGENCGAEDVLALGPNGANVAADVTGMIFRHGWCRKHQQRRWNNEFAHASAFPRCSSGAIFPRASLRDRDKYR